MNPHERSIEIYNLSTDVISQFIIQFIYQFNSSWTTAAPQLPIQSRRHRPVRAGRGGRWPPGRADRGLVLHRIDSSLAVSGAQEALLVNRLPPAWPRTSFRRQRGRRFRDRPSTARLGRKRAPPLWTRSPTPLPWQSKRAIYRSLAGARRA